MTCRAFIKFLLMFFLYFSLQAFSKPTHSKLEIKTTTGKDQSIKFIFKVIPNNGLKVTHDAPWKLTIEEGAKDLGMAAGVVYKGKEYDGNIPGFQFIANPKSTKMGTISYQLKSFICTEDKTLCYPEVHSGKYHWKSSP